MLLTLSFDEMNQCTQHSPERSGRRTHLILVPPHSLHTGIRNVTPVLTVAYGPSPVTGWERPCVVKVLRPGLIIAILDPALALVGKSRNHLELVLREEIGS